MPDLELFGRYRAVRRLGVGAFATVWLARDEQLDGPVAVKVLADNWASRGDVRERFLEEARMLRRADSDRVVRVHDIGELPDGRPYFVMTYADRGILADRLTDFPMPARDALWYARETARGVAVLHARGIIHRDVKPSNVLLRTGDGDSEQVLVSDLGLAKAVAVASGITLTAGTPGYMPPEQAEGIGLTFASDVYALGALTYRLLAGRLPHQVGSPLSVLSSATEPVPALELSAGLPPALDAVLRRALSRDPADRQADAQAFARALSGAAGTLLDAGPEIGHGDLVDRGDQLADRLTAWGTGGGRSTAGVGSAGLGRVGADRDLDGRATVITRTRPAVSLEPAGSVEPAGPVAVADPVEELPVGLSPARGSRHGDGDRHRGRTAALVSVLVVALLLAAGLVGAVAEPGLYRQARAVLAGDRVVSQSPLSITVPASWSQRSARNGPVPGIVSPTAELTVSSDLGRYRSDPDTEGVFVGLANGDQAAAARAGVRYPGCSAAVRTAGALPGWTGTAASRSCGSARVLTWVGTSAAGGAGPTSTRTLFVEVKVRAGQQAVAERVLRSVSVGS